MNVFHSKFIEIGVKLYKSFGHNCEKCLTRDGLKIFTSRSSSARFLVRNHIILDLKCDFLDINTSRFKNISNYEYPTSTIVHHNGISMFDSTYRFSYHRWVCRGRINQ